MFQLFTPQTLSRMVADAVRYYGENDDEPSEVIRRFFQMARRQGAIVFDSPYDFLRDMVLEDGVSSQETLLIGFCKLMVGDAMTSNRTDYFFLRAVIDLFTPTTLERMLVDLTGETNLVELVNKQLVASL